MGVMPYSPRSSAARSPARPWYSTAAGTACSGASPWPSRDRIHPRQHVPAAPLGHARVAGGVDEGPPIREGGDGTVPLQDQDTAVGPGKVPGRPQPVRPGHCPGQAGKLPVVGGEHGQSARPRPASNLSICPETAFRPSASSTTGTPPPPAPPPSKRRLPRRGPGRAPPGQRSSPPGRRAPGPAPRRRGPLPRRRAGAWA